MTNSLSGLRSFFRPWARDLVSVAARARLSPRVTSTLRSYSYQARLYRDYLAGRNPYPVLPPGSSAHELGLAFDLVVYPMSALRELGQVWEGWGGVWGGRFRDEVHFEFPGASHVAVAAAQETPPKGTPWWLWSPSKAGTVCDFVAGKWWSFFLPEGKIKDVVGSPCTSLLKTAKSIDEKLGYTD